MADDLRSLLKEAKPTWSAQDLSAVQRKLTKIGIQSAKELSESFSQLNELLAAAGFLKFSNETLEELKLRLPRPKVEGLLDRAPLHRKNGFGGPSPHRVFQHHRDHQTDLQVKTFDWKGWTVKPASNPPLLARACEMPAYAAELDELPEDEDDEDDEALSEEDMMKLCVAKKIPLLQLESSRRAMSVIRQLDRLEKMSISALRTEYKRRGFAPDANLRRELLLSQVKDAVIRENLKLEDLQNVCRQQQLPVEEAKSRSSLMQLLADASWFAVGIPVQQLPSLVVAHGILDSVASLHSKQLPELIASARRMGVPLEQKPDREELLPRIVKAMVWKQMDDAALRLECERCGAPVDDIPENAMSGGVKLMVNNGCKLGRQKMEQLLLQSLWLDIWKANGITVQSLGSHESAAKLFSEVEQLHSEDLAQVQSRYKALDLPLGQLDDHKWVMQRVSESLFWEALPMTELLEECEMRGVSISDTQHQSDEDARRSLVRKLVKESCLRAWVKMGIPVSRLGDARAAALVAEEWRSLATISSPDLKIKCELHGVPVDAGLERHDLLQLLRDIAVWESMPMHELKQEIAKSTGPAVCDRGLDEFRQHCQLVEQLLLRRCAEFYEGKGIPARRLGSLKAAANLAKELADLDRQESSSLKSECRRLGVPAEHLRQQELVELHREISLWRALPAAELRLECRAKSVACPQPQSLVTEDELKEMLVDALLIEKCEAWYERRGIPVRKLGSVKAAMTVAEKWEQLDSLSEGGLLFKASAFSIHLDKDCKRKEVIQRVKQAMLWSELPLKELQRIARAHGLSGRENNTKELLHRLTSTLWPPPPPPPPEPKPKPMKFEHFGSQNWQNFKKAVPPAKASKNMMPHFNTLGLAPNSGAADIKKAYRKLALKYHPDKNLEASKEEASRRFREVAEAYAALNQFLG